MFDSIKVSSVYLIERKDFKIWPYQTKIKGNSFQNLVYFGREIVIKYWTLYRVFLKTFSLEK